MWTWRISHDDLTHPLRSVIWIVWHAEGECRSWTLTIGWNVEFYFRKNVILICSFYSRHYPWICRVFFRLPSVYRFDQQQYPAAQHVADTRHQKSVPIISADFVRDGAQRRANQRRYAQHDHRQTERIRQPFQSQVLDIQYRTCRRHECCSDDNPNDNCISHCYALK